MVRDPRVRGDTLRRAFGGASMRGGRSTARASSMAGTEHADPVMVRGRPRSGQTKGGSGGGRACSCPPKDRATAGVRFAHWWLTGAAAALSLAIVLQTAAPAWPARNSSRGAARRAR